MKHGFLGVGAAIMVALCIFPPAVSQEMPEQDCGPLCVCVMDASCGAVTGCDANGADCEKSSSFTITCTSGASLKLEIFLSCDDCEHCFACAVIVNAAGQLQADVQTGCDALGCRGTRAITLGAGTYTLQACLRKCPNPDTCTQCSGCTAKARVFRLSSDCSSPCDWQ